MTKPKLFVLLFGLCCWPQLFVYAEERMRVGISAVSLGFLPTVLAEKKGLYTKYGLVAEHVLVPCAIATNALLSEDLDYAVCTGPGIAGAIKGLPIKLIMTTQDKLGYLLLVKPNIQKLTDLRGKTIGISTFGSQLYLTSVTLFRKAGMETGKDVNLLPAGDNNARIAAMESGKIDATFVSSPADIFGAKRGSVDEVVRYDALRRYMIAFAGAAYQNPASICAQHHMLLPRLIRSQIVKGLPRPKKAR